jgi:hypothetical protein
MSYTNDEKLEIMRRARETVERLEHLEKRADAAAAHFENGATVPFPPFEDRLAKWKREGEEQMERERAERQRRDLEVIERRVTSNVLANVQALIDAEHTYLLEEFLPHMWAEMTAENEASIKVAYAEAIADLRADLAALRQAVQRNGEAIRKFTGAGDDDKVIDLPTLRSMKPLN